MNQSSRVCFPTKRAAFAAAFELIESTGKIKTVRAQHGAVTMIAAFALSAGIASGSAAAAVLITPLAGPSAHAICKKLNVKHPERCLDDFTGGPSVKGVITPFALTSGNDGIAISQNGAQPQVGDAGDIAIGSEAVADSSATVEQPAVAVGYGAKAQGAGIGIGAEANASGTGAVATGYKAAASARFAVAIGASANASNSNAIAAGAKAAASGDSAIAIGSNASATALNSVALGANSNTGTRVNVVSVGDVADGSQRQIINVAAGTESTDVVNLGQLTTTNDAVTALGGRVGENEGGIVAINDTLAGLGATVSSAVVYNADKSMVSLGGTSGTIIDNLSTGIISATSKQAVNGSQLFTMQTEWDQKLSDLTGTPDIVINDLQDKYDALNGRVGDHGVQIDGINGRVGMIESGIGGGNVEGSGFGINAAGNVELGNGAEASGLQSTAVGTEAVASGTNSTALGDHASATADGTTAIGSNASATGDNAVAIGVGSVAARDNSVSFGSPDNARQLTNVADGSAATDAVNMRQMDGAIAGVNGRIDRLDTRIDEMGAMSAASTQMALSTAGLRGAHRLGAGIGFQNGESALALGYQHVYARGARTLSVGGSASSRGTVSFGAGAGIAW
ncbi:YadA-like family protein [Glaciimonas sp. PAMC28666]|uniref:YadA family autotransporter adhesin n=1 Tax=Glaciimonas sp. PAMC28666 TaxID=2807626 RepID=UPI0019656E7C|nr:YadA-like family protein [Glaciimonas sp. PAMC28666]QRX81577.1 YadA-like family protein [Glaciimonas sp. PAMC28666]